MSEWTIRTLLETAAGYLRDRESTSPRLDAELLLAEALGLERIDLYTQYDRPVVAPELDRFRELVTRRARHEPVAYILGRSHFRHLCLEVTPAVLIPRPETEELVEAALELLRVRPPWGTTVDVLPQGSVATSFRGLVGAELQRSDRHALPATKALEDSGALQDVHLPSAVGPARPVIADVGTGSGAIALSLASEAGVPVLAIDLSAEALEVAVRNRAALRLDKLVELRRADLLSGVPDGSLRLVVSNPPYVASDDMGSLAPDVRLFEPAGSLDAGHDGLDVFRRLLPEAKRVLAPGGSVLLEVGATQAQTVSELASREGYAIVSTRKDLSGKDRIVEATLPGVATADFSGISRAQLAALDAALRAGAVIGIPTDTVYGLAARWDSHAGVQRLFLAKGRPGSQAVAVIFASLEAVRNALPDLTEPIVRVLEGLLPGPFTFVVPTSVPRPAFVGTSDSLGIRVPHHPALLEFLQSLGTALAATSANRTGERDAVSFDEVDPTVLAHCSLALTGSVDRGEETSARSSRGASTGTVCLASTVVDLRPLMDGGLPLVLREGAVTKDQVLDRIAALK